MRTLAALLLAALPTLAADPPQREIVAVERHLRTVVQKVAVPGGGTETVTRQDAPPVQFLRKFAPAKSALILCDVWDDH